MLLAIDGGGTKTYLLITENDGTVLADAQSGPLSLEVVDKIEAQKNLFEALEIAEKKTNRSEISLTKCLIGLAGIDTQNELENANHFFSSILKNKVNGPITVVNDSKIALASGSLSPNAIILIAGTGSNCIGKSDTGEEAKAGGLGYLLTDEGSGYFIGDKILRSAIQSFEGRGPKTVLEDLIKTRFQIKDILELKEKINVHNFQKTTISQLSHLLSQALEANDQVARDILKEANLELIKMVYAVGTKLNFQTKDFDLVLTGSLFSIGLINFDYFTKKIKENFPKVNPILPTDPPVYGALKLLLA
jgi:N-acetylglucosamine kinase-like BadF-type ATPase